MSYIELAPGPTLYHPGGTSARWRLTIKECRTCPALDLTDVQEIEFIVKATPTTLDTASKFTKTKTGGDIIAVDLALGLADVVIAADDTSAADGFREWAYVTRVTLEDGTIIQPFGLSGVYRLDATVPQVDDIMAADSTVGTIEPVALTPAPLPTYATIQYVDSSIADEAAARIAGDKPLKVTGNFTATLNRNHDWLGTTGTATDPTGAVDGDEWVVNIQTGTLTIGGTPYTNSEVVSNRVSGAWVRRVGGGGSTTDASALITGTLDPARIADGSLLLAKFVEPKTTNFTAVIGHNYRVSAGFGTITITDPSSPSADQYYLVEYSGNTVVGGVTHTGVGRLIRTYSGIGWATSKFLSGTFVPLETASGPFTNAASPFPLLNTSGNTYYTDAATYLSALGGVSSSYVQTAVAAPFSALTDGATVTITCNAAHGSQNRTLSIAASVTRALVISGATSGMSGILKVTNGGNSGLTLPTGSKVINGGSGAVALTATASAVDVLCWTYDGTNYLWTFGANFN